MKSVKCPICGSTEFIEDGDVCEVCGWFHDRVQEDDPDYEGGENFMSLNQAKAAYARGERVE